MSQKLTVTYHKMYRKENGTCSYVYHVHGTAEQLELYKKAQGVKYRVCDDTGKPLYFTFDASFGKEGSLVITSNGLVIVDTADDEIISSAIQKYAKAGNTFMAETLAKEYAQDIIAQIRGKKAQAPVVVDDVVDDGTDVNDL